MWRIETKEKYKIQINSSQLEKCRVFLRFSCSAWFFLSCKWKCFNMLLVKCAAIKMWLKNVVLSGWILDDQQRERCFTFRKGINGGCIPKNPDNMLIITQYDNRKLHTTFLHKLQYKKREIWHFASSSQSGTATSISTRDESNQISKFCSSFRFFLISK